jgi:hypothetical protein
MLVRRRRAGRQSHPITVTQADFHSFETERQTSFFTTGGLVGLHAEDATAPDLGRAATQRGVRDHGRAHADPSTC